MSKPKVGEERTLRLSCYVCGEAIEDKFQLASERDSTDHVFVLHPECEGHLHEDVHVLPASALATDKALLEAVEWVISDAAYKAPELIGPVCARWIGRLQRALPKDSK